MVISIVNHKGGTGKTTTTINLGSALAAMNQRVLLLDFDAQGSLSYSLGIDESSATVAELLLGEVSFNNVLHEREEMHVVAAGVSLADVELAMAKSENRFNHLQAFANHFAQYDFVLIDCPPSLSLLTLNALIASDYIIVPMQMDVLALRGLDSMLETVKKVNQINPTLEVLGILPVMAEPRKNIYQEITNHIKANYLVRLFDAVIHTSVKAAEAPSFGKSVVRYAPSSSTANDYRAFANEILTLKENIYQPITNG